MKRSGLWQKKAPADAGVFFCVTFVAKWVSVLAPKMLKKAVEYSGLYGIFYCPSLHRRQMRLGICGRCKLFRSGEK